MKYSFTLQVEVFTSFPRLLWNSGGTAFQNPRVSVKYIKCNVKMWTILLWTILPHYYILLYYIFCLRGTEFHWRRWILNKMSTKWHHNSTTGLANGWPLGTWVKKPTLPATPSRHESKVQSGGLRWLVITKNRRLPKRLEKHTVGERERERERERIKRERHEIGPLH